MFTMKLSWSLLYVLAMVNLTVVAELDLTMAIKLLQQEREIPAIPTKNGFYIFVPTSHPNANSDSRQNTNIKHGQEEKFSIPQMRGVNRAGMEFSCVQNLGISDGPVDDASVKAIKKWNADIVRIPLNEDCWLGINGVNSAFSGNLYRSAVSDYVTILLKNGLKVILGLHWSDGVYNGPGHVECADFMAKCQKPMPDAENAPKFWQSVANQFKYDDNIIFDLFDNPNPDKAIQNKTAAWECWRNGGNACNGFQYRVAGMQDLVNAVRDTGATNPVMIGGINSANDLTKWKENIPDDPKSKIIASWHSFKENQCNNINCWNTEIAPIANEYPIIVGEIGEKGCSDLYISKLMDWLDEKSISYLGWTWNTWDCSSGPSLISDYNGTPTEFGRGLYDRMNGKVNKA